MATSTQTDAEFWRGVLTAGTFTAIPRWSGDRVPGTAEYTAAVPDELLASLRRWADEADLPLSSVLLAAHAKVLAALSGEQAVATYVRTPDGTPLPCRLSTASGTWRALIEDTDRAQAELLAHQDFPVDDFRRELGLGEPLPETLFDPYGDGDGRERDTVLRVALPHHGARRGLRLFYRTDVLDAECAARIAGYHLTALALIAADPEADHGRQSLLSAGELDLQLDGLAGPHRELPDRRFHELFEEQVRIRPDAVAAVQGERQWTYEELNTRANRLAGALLARGLRRQDVVAVVTERNLDWMAAVIGVFKAGGVYLPVEPHFPAGRIAAMLDRAACRLVLTEPGSTATLDEALESQRRESGARAEGSDPSQPGRSAAAESRPGVQTLLVEAAYAEDHSDADPGVRVGPDQLAYVFFTSGSTGEPKGAMCEHAGMLNHLYAKIDDLGIDEGHVVAQTAPQCFDISLWQLLAPVLAGGRTLLVGQEAVLDARQFLDTVVDGRVAVLQVVPSYLDAVLSCLERHPRELPDLRRVSVTGEALKMELVQRWFAAQPGIALVNAYGLTETSDDTNHEVMDRVPDTDRVPLGRPVNNVHIYVVDEHLSPVPLGAPGAIVFSGVCVGRGYINDPERTRPAFMDDPHRPGLRLHRGGDYGRWLPGGKLEFLGRKDSQVKIRGFRIEIGEIENTLLRTPGVRNGAVVITRSAGRSAHLVAFYSGPGPLEADDLRHRLSRSLPPYMVPSSFHWQESLPLTANGKIDKKALTALAEQLDAAGPPEAAENGHRAPLTPTEQRLAAAWAPVLGIPQERVGRLDHFFDHGGTSLTAVKLVVSLDRVVSLKDITRHPVLADLAALVDERAAAADATDGPSPQNSPLLRPVSVPDGPQPAGPQDGAVSWHDQPSAASVRPPA
ncbi:non-ribosomal peptide synthetase [Streptomyces sp. NBC_00306]|uniref:non-ribosomal peptide synthetase n=1 Tax=Streptomyces sp. NBC_00306 TaxID=2975708 RepID=UPI002E2801C5|nr:amino acid adenylation domain-containing protein [Streptomyces sp. NBC_00306]